jgi:predicted Zn finger-like uncharacterized protein
MAVNTICPRCRASYQLADAQQGQKVRCNHCYSVFLVPKVPPAAPAQPAWSAAPTAQPVSRSEVVSRPQPRIKQAAVTARPAPPVSQTRISKNVPSEPQRKSGGKSVLPWLIGCGAAGSGLAVLAICGIVAAVLLSGGKSESPETPKSTAPEVTLAAAPPQPVAVPPLVQPANHPLPDKPVEATPPRKEVQPPPTPAKEEPRKAAPASNGKLGRDDRARVKRATVYLRVTMFDGSKASGTGFFGCAEAPDILLTNAHVVGMLSPDSSKPQKIEVFVNSGEANEWKASADVLGVDRDSDLAVLGLHDALQKAPEPLTVKSAGGLQELDTVYIFGFPFGEQLGKEITVNESSVSSLRKKGGALHRVQVNGGMNPGNSGGPVVDPSGAVVGVAVSGIPGRQINFAIPGDRVHTILNGRVSRFTYHLPYLTDEGRIAMPAVLETIDPRQVIKEVGVEIWAGDKPPANAPTRKALAPAQPGDSPHIYYQLHYEASEGRADVVLPELPPGKVYWHQPRWTNAAGQVRKVVANVVRLPTQPVQRKPAKLVLRYPQGVKRAVDLNIDNSFKVSNDDDADTFHVRTNVGLTETIDQTGPGGSQLTLRYRVPPQRDLILPGNKKQPSSLLAQIKNDLPRMITQLQIDPVGNITRQSLDQRALAPLTRSNPRQVQRMKDFHEVVQQALESLSVSLPAGSEVKPLETWKATRHLPIDTPGRFETGKLDVTFTFLGVRTREGRDEALINMSGVVRGGAGVNGKANGHLVLDLATGQTMLARSNVALQLEAVLSEPGEAPRKLRVLATMEVRLQRKL